MKAAFGGGRKIALCRELTKLHEEIIRTTIDGAIEIYAQKPPRGEYVLVVEGAAEPAQKEDAFWRELSVYEHVNGYINDGMTQKDAIKAAAADRGIPKRDVYNEYHRKEG